MANSTFDEVIFGVGRSPLAKSVKYKKGEKPVLALSNNSWKKGKISVYS